MFLGLGQGYAYYLWGVALRRTGAGPGSDAGGDSLCLCNLAQPALNIKHGCYKRTRRSGPLPQSLKCQKDPRRPSEAHTVTYNMLFGPGSSLIS